MKVLKKFGQYAALAIGLGMLTAAPVKAAEPIIPRQELNLELKSLEDRTIDYNESEFINLEEHAKEESGLNLGSKLSFIIPNLATGYLTKLLWHETVGHMLTAKYLGCTHIKLTSPASYSLVNPPDMTNFEEGLINVAGVEATTSLSLVLYEALKKDQIPKPMKPWVATLSLVALMDRHQYLIGSAFLNYARIKPHPGNDFHNLMTSSFGRSYLEGYYVEESGYFIVNDIVLRVQKGDILREDENGNYYNFRPYADKEGNFRKMLDKRQYRNVNGVDRKTQKKIDIAYGVALAASVVELGLRYDEIKYLVGTAIGDNPKAPEGMEVLKAGFYPIQNGFFVSIDGVF